MDVFGKSAGTLVEQAERIGDQLGITANTVKYHVANLLRKYGARTRAELASIAHSHDAHSPSAQTR